MKKIISYDFDGTMCFTPEPETGKKTYKKVTGKDWPYPGWWGRGESLDLNIFSIPVNPLVYSDYIEYLQDEDCYTFIATGRLKKIQKQVESVLKENDLRFHEIHCNPGMDTYVFKAKLFEEYIKRHSPDVFVMYDDRHEHLVKFAKWATTQPCQIDIIDVVNKTHKIFNKS